MPLFTSERIHSTVILFALFACFLLFQSCTTDDNDKKAQASKAQIKQPFIYKDNSKHSLSPESVYTDTEASPVTYPVKQSGSTTGSDNLERCRKRELKRRILTEVDNNVFVLGIKLGAQRIPQKNISWIETDEGVVVIDTGNPFSAKVTLSLIRKRTKKPIRYIIYTHHHGNHVAGTDILKGKDTQVIAHEDLPLEFDLAVELIDHQLRINSIQFDIDVMPIPNHFKIIYPDITYNSEYRFTLGGVDFELYHVVGEARDYTVVYLPAQRIVWVADLVSYGAPMVASPMKRVRDEIKWKQALELIKKLQPEVLVNSVLPPLCDCSEIETLLNVHIEYLDFLHESVFREINQNSTLEEALKNIRLPDHLASDPRVRDGYGSLEFNIRGLYHRYSGWFDCNGSTLKSVPKKQVAAHFISDMGGPEKVIQKANLLWEKGDLELSLEYLDLIINAGKLQVDAHRMKGNILQELSAKYIHPITSNMFRRLGKMEIEKANLSIDN